MNDNKSLSWNQRPSVIILLLIVFFPIGLYLMWKNSLWSKRTRWIVTGVISLVFIVIGINGGSSPYTAKYQFVGVEGYSVALRVKFDENGIVDMSQRNQQSGLKTYDSGTFVEVDNGFRVNFEKWDNYDGLWIYEDGKFKDPEGSYWEDL